MSQKNLMQVALNLPVVHCHRLSDSVCLFEFGTGSWIKSNSGQRFSWGWGGLFREEV